MSLSANKLDAFLSRPRFAVELSLLFNNASVILKKIRLQILYELAYECIEINLLW